MAKKKKSADRQLLSALIEEATVDCYGEDEQFTGLCCMVEEEVVVPFKAKVVGEKVTVTSLEPADEGHSLQATCERNGKKYRVDLTSLEWVKPLPQGFEWIEAYLAWREWNS